MARAQLGHPRIERDCSQPGQRSVLGRFNIYRIVCESTNAVPIRLAPASTAGCVLPTAFARRLLPFTIVALVTVVAACTPADGPESVDGRSLPEGDQAEAGAATTEPVRRGATRRSGAVGPAKTSRPNVRSLDRAELYPGAQTPSPSPSTGERTRTTSDGKITLNFSNAPLLDVIDAVLAESLQVAYTVDPEVQGRITVRTVRPLPREDVLPALEGILAANGLSLTREAGLYHIRSRDDGPGIPGGFVDRAPGELVGGRSLHIIPLSYTSAEKVRDTLEPLVQTGRLLQADAARNLLLFAGPTPEARNLIKLVEVFDVDWMQGMSVGLLPLDVADAETVVDELRTLFARDGDDPSGGVRFRPIERLNAVLTIARTREQVERARMWVSRLDRGGRGEERRVFVYFVQNGRARELADVIGMLLGSEGTGSHAGDPASQVEALDPSQRLGRTSVETEPRSNNVDDRSPSTSDNSGDPTGRQTSVVTSDGIRVVANERNNALLIRATAGEYEMIYDTLKRLDIVPLQVMIEATIAEVTLNDDLRYGLNWFFEGQIDQGTNELTLSDTQTGAVAAQFPGFSYLFESSSARVVLEALSRITDVKVISSPQLFVLDNQPARLQVGDEVPVATASVRSVIDDDSPVVNEIQFRDTGVILEVTPRVTTGGLVTLEIRQEVSDVVRTTTSNLESPTIQTRSIESTVAVQSASTVALGGLIQDNRERRESGLPVLSDIPVLGNLFKTTETRTERTELLILLTPRVARDRREAEAITRELQQRMRSVGALNERLQGEPASTDETE